MEVDAFFDAVEAELANAKKCAESSVKNIKKVVDGKHYFSDKYLKLEKSFYEIVSSISAAGYSLQQEGVVKMFGAIIEAKSTLSSATGAWDQYTHLANWLIYIATILEVKSTAIEGIFLDAVRKSMAAMSKDRKLGYSWHAYKSWRTKWDGITPNNRKLIRAHILENLSWPDALSIVSLG